MLNNPHSGSFGLHIFLYVYSSSLPSLYIAGVKYQGSIANTYRGGEIQAISPIMELQVFAPQYVSMLEVVPVLCRNLDSTHLLLRRAAANCLRQFTQRDPNTVWNLARKVWNQDTSDSRNGMGSEERGLEHVVLAKLDSESDQKLCADLREILFSLLTSLAPEDPMRWLQLCNGVLAAVNEQSQQGQQGGGGGSAGTARAEGAEEMDEDLAKFTTGEEQQPATKISPRWPTKEFAVECSRKIYYVCKSDPAHFDLSLALKQKKQKGGESRFLQRYLCVCD